MNKKEKTIKGWVRIWAEGGRGYLRKYEAYIHFSQPWPESEAKDRAERLGEGHFPTGESSYTYGYETVRRPPLPWLIEKIEGQKRLIKGTQEYIDMLQGVVDRARRKKPAKAA